MREESGYEAQIIEALPTAFAGSTSTTAYFSTKPVGSPGPFNEDETQAIQWASLDEAEGLVALTTIETGMQARQGDPRSRSRAAIAKWPD